jgi:hypothetical protein
MNTALIHVSSEKRRILNLPQEICQPQMQNETFQRKKKVTLKVSFWIRLRVEIVIIDCISSSSTISSFFPSCQKTSCMNKVSSSFPSGFLDYDIPILSQFNFDNQLSNRMYCHGTIFYFHN